MSERSKTPVVKKTWAEQIEEGRLAYFVNPSQSLRGKNDVFRQGFYAAAQELQPSTKGGYTHLISYPWKAPATGADVTVEFRTTACAVHLHVKAIVAKGVEKISVVKL